MPFLSNAGPVSCFNRPEAAIQEAGNLILEIIINLSQI